MLVLSRQRNETIYIDGEKIQITIVDVRGDKVRLGITAPPHMSVHRKEIYEAIQRDGQRRTSSGRLENDIGKENLGNTTEDGGSYKK